jgi:hypothetical protein
MELIPFFEKIIEEGMKVLDCSISKKYGWINTHWNSARGKNKSHHINPTKPC